MYGSYLFTISRTNPNECCDMTHLDVSERSVMGRAMRSDRFHMMTEALDGEN